MKLAGKVAAIPPADAGPAHVARVCGTLAYPQNKADVVARLRAAGVVLAPSDAAAARLAMEMVLP